MVISRATVALFFFFDALYPEKRSASETEVSRNLKTLVDKRILSTQPYCLPSGTPKKEHKGFPNNPYYYLWTDSSHPRTFELGPYSQIGADLNAAPNPGFMDVISRLPPPGGTTALDILHYVLITSYHMSLYLSDPFHPFLASSHTVDIVFNADYEQVFGGRVGEFRDFLLWHLKLIFRKSYSDIQSLQIRKGSIGITFFVHLMSCVCARVHNPSPMAEAKEETYHESSQVNGDHEIEFVHFLNYLNYRISPPKHYNLINYIPFNIKMTSMKESGRWYYNVKQEEPKWSEITLLRREPLKTGIISDSKYAKLKPNTLQKRLEYKNSQERHQGVMDSVSRFKASPKHPRMRRYVSSENKNVAKLKVSFKLENPTAEGNRDEFQQHLVSQLAKAMRIPVPSIQDLRISQDIDVSFTLSAFNDANNVMDDVSVMEAVDFLKAKIKSQQLQLKDLNGQLLMTAGRAYASLDESADYSLGILVILCITLLVLALLIVTLIYLARRTSSIPKSSNTRNEAYRNLNFGRDSSQSVGKYSLDSGLWLGPGPEPPNFSVPDAPYYRPPTVEQISSTPRPQTAVRTRLKKNWNVDERALSTIPDDRGRNYVEQGHLHR